MNTNNIKTQSFDKMKYDLRGHPRSYEPTLCQNHSSTLVYGPIFRKISMKTQFYHILK